MDMRNKQGFYYTYAIDNGRVENIKVNVKNEGVHNLGMNIFVIERELLIDLINTAFVRGLRYWERDVLLIQPFFQLGEFLLQGQAQTQLVPDLQVTGGDDIKDLAAIHTILGVGVAEIKKVGDLVVVLAAIAGCGDDDHSAALICQDDIPYLAVLTGVCHGGAAEFCNFQHLYYLTVPWRR